MKLLFSISFALLLSLSACGDKKGSTRVKSQRENSLLRTRSFPLITPTGEKIMREALKWKKGQEAEADIYAAPAQCAKNVSRVLENSGILNYSSPLVSGIVSKVENAGGKIIRLPKTRSELVKKIDTLFHGRIPAGTIVMGCLRSDCTGEAGDGHVGLVGDRDSFGRLQLYHNNWYRPDNENGIWKKHMIPLDWYNIGFRRKWMPTPWLKITNSSVTTVSDVHVSLPAIDDLDPTNYFLTLAIMPQIISEIRSDRSVASDGKGRIVALPYSSLR